MLNYSWKTQRLSYSWRATIEKSKGWAAYESLELRVWNRMNSQRTSHKENVKDLNEQCTKLST